VTLLQAKLIVASLSNTS